MKNYKIATYWNIWREYYDTSGSYTEEEFFAMDIQEKMDILIDAFGDDSGEDDPEYWELQGIQDRMEIGRIK